MKYALVVLMLVVAGCKNDKFIQQYDPWVEGRYSKTYKLDTTTSENYAVDVDILWVIDNSGSMGPYQQRVIANSAAFIQQFKANSRLRWKMGLISTDESDNPYMGFTSPVDWTHADPGLEFNNAVAQLGTWGSGWEESFNPTLKHLNNHPNFLRPNAYFVMIIVTDEVEQSTIGTQEFINRIVAKVGTIAKFFAYGVYTRGSNDAWNKKNEEIVQKTSGKIYQLDSNDYGKLLSELGKDLVSKTSVVYPTILLDQKPKIDTIRVVYKGRVLLPGSEWMYNPEFNYIQITDPTILDTKYLDANVSFEIDRS